MATNNTMEVVSALLFGRLSDKLGRYPCYLGALCFELVNPLFFTLFPGAACSTPLQHTFKLCAVQLCSSSYFQVAVMTCWVVLGLLVLCVRLLARCVYTWDVGGRQWSRTETARV